MSIEEQIGSRVRELRNQNGLTQEELADRTELTKGFISQLERGLTAPSVATLADIVECLGVSMSEFFMADDQQQVTYPKEEYFEKTDEDGNTTLWLVADAQKKSMEPILVKLEPGNNIIPDKPHEGEEFGYVLSGTIHVHYGDRVFTVKEGDSFLYPADRTHFISASEEGPASCIWISSPPNF